MGSDGNSCGIFDGLQRIQIVHDNRLVYAVNPIRLHLVDNLDGLPYIPRLIGIHPDFNGWVRCAFSNGANHSNIIFRRRKADLGIDDLVALASTLACHTPDFVKVLRFNKTKNLHFPAETAAPQLIEGQTCFLTQNVPTGSLNRVDCPVRHVHVEMV